MSYPDNLEVTLKERCKLVVWMDQFQSSEIVQLKFRKYFDKGPPIISFIDEIFNMFMTTGSVYGVNAEGKINSLVDDENFSDESFEGNDYVEDDDDYEDVGNKKDNRKSDSQEEIQLFPAEGDEEIIICNLAAADNGEITETEEYSMISINRNEYGHENCKIFACDFCGFKTTDRALFMDHRKAHDVKDYFQCSFCSFTTNNSSFYRNHRRKCEGNTNCSWSSSYNVHSVANSSAVKCFTCFQCGKAYSSVSSLNMHRAFHSKLRPFACEKCDYRFYSENTLKKHEASHDKIKHLECPHCSYKCNMSGNMIVHLRTHTGEKPYKCADCSYATGNPSVYKRHLAKHSNETEYRCRKCNYKTNKESLFIKHGKSHYSDSEYACHLCDTRCRSSYALRYHINKMHSEREILECPFCDFRQTDESLLKIHIRRHTGERPYGCPRNNCSFRAMRSQDLKKHLLKIHNTK